MILPLELWKTAGGNLGDFGKAIKLDVDNHWHGQVTPFQILNQPLQPSRSGLDIVKYTNMQNQSTSFWS